MFSNGNHLQIGFNQINSTIYRKKWGYSSVKNHWGFHNLYTPKPNGIQWDDHAENFLIRVNSSDIIIEINNNNNSNIITTKINIIYIYIYDMCQSLIYSLAIIIFDLTPVAFDPCDCWVTPSHCVWQMGDTSWPNFFIRPKFHIFSLWFFNFCSFKFLFSWKTSHHSHHSFPREHLPVPVEICQCHT